MIEYALLWGLCSAIIGTVFAAILPLEDTPLSWYFRAILWLETPVRNEPAWISTFYSWIASIFGGCAKCFSGQLALWTWALTQCAWDNLFQSIATTSTCAATAVLVAFFLSKLVTWMDRIS